MAGVGFCFRRGILHYYVCGVRRDKMKNCCGKHCVWVAFGHKQYEGPLFSVIDIFLCETCRKITFYERSEKFQGKRENHPSAYSKFILDRDTRKWLQRPKDKYDVLAKRLGISRLHAIYEIDGA